MAGWFTALCSVLTSGTIANATSTAALALFARAESKGALQPVNSTSCWINGKQAAAFRKADLAHTTVGSSPHHAATVFWAVLFERCVDVRRPSAVLLLVRDALTVSAFAAAVDYEVTPKRFTQRWEFVLCERSTAATYAAMALWLAAGASINRSVDW